jgi:hypothetical protein
MAGIMLAFGILFIAFGSRESLWCVAVGVPLLTGSWFVARAQPGAESVNGWGTGFFGEVETSAGSIITKWVCVFIPLLPVRSFYVLDAKAGVSDFLPGFQQVTHYKLLPLPGLGLHWPSVRKTIFRTLFALAIVACAIMVFIAWALGQR